MLTGLCRNGGDSLCVPVLVSAGAVLVRNVAGYLCWLVVLFSRCAHSRAGGLGVALFSCIVSSDVGVVRWCSDLALECSTEHEALSCHACLWSACFAPGKSSMLLVDSLLVLSVCFLPGRVALVVGRARVCGFSLARQGSNACMFGP